MSDGRKRRRSRPEDALPCLDLALREPRGSARRLQRLEQALLIYALGKYWPGAKTCRGHARIRDADAVAAMQKLSATSRAPIVAGTLKACTTEAEMVVFLGLADEAEKQAIIAGGIVAKQWREKVKGHWWGCVR